MRKKQISDMLFTLSCMIIGVYAYMIVFLSWIFEKKHTRRSAA